MREHEDLADHVGVLLVAGHETDDLTAGGRFDDVLEAVPHHLLEDHALADDVVAVAAFQQGLFDAGEAAAYFTVCEALTNVDKYARASRAWVTVERRDGHLDVEVGDDGLGGADMGSGSGLQGLRDRIAAVNGTLDIDSRSGVGTVLRARLPLEPSPEQ